MKGHEVTERDCDILTYVARHGACTPDQVDRCFFTSESACFRRLRALRDLRLLDRHLTFAGRPHVFVTSRMGIRLCGVDLPPARFILPTMEHTLSVVDLSEDLLDEHPGSSWLTERELRRDAMREQRERGFDVLQANRPRSPDGLLVLKNGKTVAIELDLTPKRSDIYMRLLGTYAAKSGISGVWWFTPKAAVAGRLQSLVKDSDMTSFVEVHEWTPPIRRGPEMSLEA